MRPVEVDKKRQTSRHGIGWKEGYNKLNKLFVNLGTKHYITYVTHNINMITSLNLTLNLSCELRNQPWKVRAKADDWW